MQYFLRRGEQLSGPYTLADLQRYVQSGDISSDDLTQSEGMTDWMPVSQVLGNIPAIAVTSGGAAAAPAPGRELVPLPPNWHWSIVLILGLGTRLWFNLVRELVPLPPNWHRSIVLILGLGIWQLFNLVWVLIQANWACKLSNDNKPMVLVAMYPASIIAGILVIVMFRGSGLVVLSGLVILGGVASYLVGVFTIRAAMEDYYLSVEPIGLTLSPIMTFFFTTTYIQYHINRLARWKETGVLS